MITGRFLLRLVAVAASLALLAACGGDGGGGQADPGQAPTEGAEEDTEAVQDGETETLMLGSMGPMTGASASFGVDWWNGTRLAIEETEEDGGCNGYTFEAIQADSEGDAGQGVSAANDLLARDVWAVIGPILSSVTLPVTELLERNQVPTFSGSSANDVTDRGLQYTFRMAFREDESGPFDAKTAREIVGANTAVAVHDSTAFAQGLAEEFVDAFEEEGGEIVSTEVISPGESDYSSALTRIRDYNADVVYYAGYFPEGGQLVRQGKELGIENDNVPGGGWLFGNSNFSPEFLEIAGDAAEGVLIATWPGPQTDPDMAAYAEAYEERWNEQPGSLGHWAYDAVHMLCEVLERTGSSDMDEVLSTLRSDDFEFTGVSGPIEYDEKGDRLFPPLAVITVEDGDYALNEEQPEIEGTDG